MARDHQGRFLPGHARPVDPKTEVAAAHSLGRFGNGYGCGHCGYVFLGCRSHGEAVGRLGIHRAAVVECQERRANGESNLVSESEWKGIHN